MRINIFIAILVIVSAVLPILATKLVTKLTEKYSREARSIFGGYVGRLFEMIKGLREIKLLSATGWSRKAMSGPLSDMLSLGNSIRYTDFYVNKSVHLLNLLTSLLIYWLSVKLIAVNNISIGMLFAAIEYIALLHKKFNWMLRIYLDWFNRKVSIDKVSEILDIDTEIDNGIEIDTIEEIVFNNLSFSYGSEEILKDLRFNIKAREHIAIVGVSGVGKTTIAGLIMKFYKPKLGNISVNSIPIDLIKNSSLRQQVGWVGQDVFLFNDTLKYNLTLGSEKIGDEQINAILQEVWLNFLPKDLNTQLGVDGVDFSGGQKQLLAIARVLLKRPSLIIFDEMTANLDENTEEEILEYIRNNYNETTMIFISHRSKTVKLCERIIVLKDGMVEKVGTHDFLLQHSSEYIKMFGRQGA